MEQETVAGILKYYQGIQPSDQTEVLALLREIQEACGGTIPYTAQEQAAELLGVKITYIWAILKRIPGLRGECYRHHVVVCTGPRCLAKKGYDVLREVECCLGIEPGQITKDNRFRLDTRNCMKQCGTSPNLRIDQDFYPQVAPEDVRSILGKYD